MKVILLGIPWQKKPQQCELAEALNLMVARPGIEPGTQGFSIPCSTDWAIEPSRCGIKPVEASCVKWWANLFGYGWLFLMFAKIWFCAIWVVFKINSFDFSDRLDSKSGISILDLWVSPLPFFCFISKKVNSESTYLRCLILVLRIFPLWWSK